MARRTSLDDVHRWREAVRSHRSIENEIRRGHAPHNVGVIRHLALNLLQREPSRLNVRKKRLRAALNDHYRDKVLMAYPFYMRLP